MIKIDLITGFLGAGKTTFLLKYVPYFINKGEKIAILINDYGPINVDMMLLSDLDCENEMVSGTNDYECHFRRFKTKLISFALRGFDRIIVEPSGLFNPDEFFDSLAEEPLSNWYEIGNIISLIDINLDLNGLSEQSKYYLTAETSVSGKIVITKRNACKLFNIDALNQIYKKFFCDRIIKEKDVLYNDNLDMSSLENASYYSSNYIKLPDTSGFQMLFFMNEKLTTKDIESISSELFNNKKYGNIIRIKGFIKQSDNWYKINIDKFDNLIEKINLGQEVIIIIGENLDKELINRVVLCQQKEK